MTRLQVQRKAEKRFRAANSDAGSLAIEWTKLPRYVTYPTGVKGWHGNFVVKSEGFRTKRFLVECDYDGSGMIIR